MSRVRPTSSLKTSTEKSGLFAAFNQGINASACFESSTFCKSAKFKNSSCLWNLAYFEQYNTFNAQASTGWCHTEVSVVAKTLKVYSHEDEVTNETFN